MVVKAVVVVVGRRRNRFSFDNGTGRLRRRGLRRGHGCSLQQRLSLFFGSLPPRGHRSPEGRRS